MSRVTDPIVASPTSSPLSGVPVADDRANAVLVRDGLAGKQVCPFCGSQNPISATNANTTRPCPRCTMEDTAATRQATKARIGPWHVLQTRNPAAPGMRYATLLALVGKGQVSARSVVRGPTTHQLWRYAAHVKGLSREFAVCYSCGEAIEKTAVNCPHCDRGQEPVGNPDALLEAREPTVATVVTTPSYAPVEASPGDPYPMVTRPAVAAPILSHAERLRTGNDVRADVRRRPDGRVLSAMELAAALQVSPAPAPPPGRPVRTVAITLAVVAVLASIIISFARPDLRRQAQDWVQAKWAQLGQAVDNFQLQKSPPPAADSQSAPAAIPSDSTPPGGATADGASGPLATPAAASPIDAGTTALHDNTSLPSTDAGQTAPAGSAPAIIPQGPGPSAANAPVNTPSDTASQAPAGSGTAPASSSPAAARPSLLQDRPVLVVGIPNATDIWLLHSRGLDAEGRQDWAEAVRCYQQIELAPREQWPGDVKVRLVNAQRQLGKHVD